MSLAKWLVYPPDWQHDYWPGFGLRHSVTFPMGDVTLPADDDPGPVEPGPVAPEPPPVKTYTVKAGDSWWRIAYNHGLTVTQLQAANLEAAARVLLPGQVLIIPVT